jgi:glycosyltransferase involved in cell wall biosynthesis
MHFGLPVLTAHTNLINEIAGEAAIYYDGSVHDLAEKMMTLYKYEALRSQQVERGNEMVSKFSWERTAEKIWMGCSK